MRHCSPEEESLMGNGNSERQRQIERSVFGCALGGVKRRLKIPFDLRPYQLNKIQQQELQFVRELLGFWVNGYDIPDRHGDGVEQTRQDELLGLAQWQFAIAVAEKFVAADYDDGKDPDNMLVLYGMVEPWYDDVEAKVKVVVARQAADRELKEHFADRVYQRMEEALRRRAQKETWSEKTLRQALDAAQAYTRGDDMYLVGCEGRVLSQVQWTFCKTVDTLTRSVKVRVEPLPGMREDWFGTPEEYSARQRPVVRRPRRTRPTEPH
jgi:hypothetical protein